MRNNFKRLGCLARLPRCRVHGAESLPAELCLARRVLSCRSFAPKAQGRAPACLPCLRRTPGAGDVCSRHEGLPRTGGASALTGSGVLLGVVWLSGGMHRRRRTFPPGWELRRRREEARACPKAKGQSGFLPARIGACGSGPGAQGALLPLLRLSPARLPPAWFMCLFSRPPEGGTAFKRRGSRNPTRCVSLFLKLRLWCLRPAVSPDSGIA